MEIKDLVGLHKLSGVDIGSDTHNQEDCATIKFILDGIIYKAIEDPSDGYRSACEEIVVVKDHVANRFKAHQVFGKMKDSGYGTHDTVQFIDVKTNKIVLEVGTDNTDDYYPCCVMSFIPENLYINRVK